MDALKLIVKSLEGFRYDGGGDFWRFLIVIGIVRYEVGYQDSIQKILEIQYGGGGGLFLEDF